MRGRERWMDGRRGLHGGFWAVESRSVVGTVCLAKIPTATSPNTQYHTRFMCPRLSPDRVCLHALSLSLSRTVEVHSLLAPLSLWVLSKHCSQ